MKKFYKENCIECGVDEAGRGPIFGSVFAGACIWDSDKNSEIIKDSKKYKNNLDRLKAYNYILENCISYGIGSASVDEINNFNIQKATILAMNRAIDNTYIHCDNVIVDGNYFYSIIGENTSSYNFETIIGGDNKYVSIAAASVIAKVSHDNYIKDLLFKNKRLEIYDIQNNMGYGTEKHMESIKKYGLTNLHRKTFKCCIDLPINYEL